MPDAELLDVSGLPVLAVKRYDRRETPAGPVRLHQEDSCQALAVPPAMKYEEQGGPTMKGLATMLRDFGSPRDVSELLRRTTFNVAIGNADAHAKNFSILHEADDPVIRLAPVYDVLSTIALKLTDNAGNPLRADPNMGQRVGGRRDIRSVTADDLIREGVTWRIRRAAASTIVTGMLEKVIDPVPSAAGDADVLASIRRQAERVRAGGN